MFTTTSYGSWNLSGDRYNTTVEASIIDAVNGADQQWREKFEQSGAAARVAKDYRDAINEALPDGVSLNGNEFYGPYHKADQSWSGELDIHAVVESIDLMAIIERHDPDNTENTPARQE